MKHLLLTTIAAVLLVGCGESQQSAPPVEVKPVEPVAEAAQPEPTTAKAPDISIHEAESSGNIEAVKKHLAAGADVNAKIGEETPLHFAALFGRKEIAEMLIDRNPDMNALDNNGDTPLDLASGKIADLLRKHGGKTGEALKAEGK